MMANDILERTFGPAHPEELDRPIDLPPGGFAVCSKFNRWGTLIAVGSADGRVFICDFVTRNVVRTLAAHAEAISSLSWSRDGRKIITTSPDNTVAIWDVLKASLIHRFSYKGSVTSASYNPRNDNQFIVQQTNHPPAFEEVEPRNTKMLVNDCPGAAEDVTTSVAFDRRANYILAGTSKGRLIIYDAKTQKMLTWCKQNNGQQIRQIYFPRRGDYIVTNTQDRVIRMYNLNDVLGTNRGHVLEPMYKVQDIVNKAAWKGICTDSHGDFICGGTIRGYTIYIWERNGTLCKILQGQRGESVNDVQWHPTRPSIVSISTGVASVWSKAHVENWSAFAPDFRELEENFKYVEKEGEFDLEDEDASEEEVNVNSDDDDIDVENVKPNEVIISSDEEEDSSFLRLDISLESGPLWYIPITPEQDEDEKKIAEVQEGVAANAPRPPPVPPVQPLPTPPVVPTPPPIPSNGNKTTTQQVGRGYKRKAPK